MVYISKYIDMGGYASYVWSSYLITFTLLILLVIKTIHKDRAIKKKLSNYENKFDK